MHPLGHDDPKVAAIIGILDDAYTAMINEETWDPDPEYVFTVKPRWGTAEGRERLIGAIDEDFLKEFRKNTGTQWYWDYYHGIKRHPEFFRLADSFRLALSQKLEQVLIQYPEKLKGPLGE